MCYDVLRDGRGPLVTLGALQSHDTGTVVR
jgi:hypothetical protein